MDREVFNGSSFSRDCEAKIPRGSCWDSGVTITRPTSVLRATVCAATPFFEIWTFRSIRITVRIPLVFIGKCFSKLVTLDGFKQLLFFQR